MAHNLFSGRAEYWAGNNWSQDFDDALVVLDEVELAAFETVATLALAKNKVCDIEFIEVEIKDGNQLRPRHFRDVIQVFGPTVVDRGSL